MRRAKLVLFGNDQGANNVLNAVQNAASAHTDLNIVRIPGLTPVSEELKKTMRESDMLVLGISSGATSGTEARHALEALAQNPKLSGKILFVEDFPGSSGIKDPAHSEIGKRALLCSIMHVPANAPEWSVYGDVRAVGFPDHWVPSIQNILEGEQLRRAKSLRKRRRGSEELVPLTADEVVIYLSGSQDPDMEMRTLQTLLSMRFPERMVVHFRAHPGERNRPELADKIAERDAFLAGTWELASPEVIDQGRMTDSRLIGASDVTVAHPGATSIFFAAALRKRMVCPMEFVTETQCQSSSWDYAQAERYVYTIGQIRDLSPTIVALLDENSADSADLRKKQEANAFTFDPHVPQIYGRNVMQVVREIIGRQ